MAFRPYKRAPQLLSLFNEGPRECPPQVTSTGITKLPPDAKLWSKDISLVHNAPDNAVSYIDHSEKLDPPQELIDAAKSWSSYLSPSDEASVTESPVINRTASRIRFTLPKKRKHPTCEEVLAKSPVNKKKRTKRADCGQVGSSHANEQLQIVCRDPIANQVKEQVNKKRTRRVWEQGESSHANEQLQIVCYDQLANQGKEPVNKKRTKRVNWEHGESSHTNEQLQIVCYSSANQNTEPAEKKRKKPPKVDCSQVVKNEVTEQLQNFIINEMNGSDLRLVIQKVLYPTDLKPDQNRLNLPLKQLITEDFLSDDERRKLESEKDIPVRLVGPTLKMYKQPMLLKIWNMSSSQNLVLKKNWRQFVEENKGCLIVQSKIQLWSFRKDQQLCFALAVVEGPPDGINNVAN